MFPFKRYIYRSLIGHGARTCLTVSGAGIAMVVFCIVSSIQEGLNQLTSDEAANRTLIVFQENRFCPTSSRLPEDYALKIAKIPGVKDVTPVQVWTNNCRASLDVIVFNGVPAEQLRQTRQLSLVSGDWKQFELQSDAAVIGRNVAQRRGLKVGDQFSVGDLNVNVAGIFRSSVPAEENVIYTSLKFLQYTRGSEFAGLVTLHEVRLDDQADADEVASKIDRMLLSGPVSTTTRRKGAFQTSTLSDLIDLIAFSHWLGYASIGLVLSLVATTTVMSVQDRVKEHAVLQTLGVRPGRVFRIIMTESLVQCIAGGLLGTAVAMIFLHFSGLAIGAEGVTISFRPSWQILKTATLISVVVGIVAGIFPAFNASRVQIVNALRQA